jgi:hypothetical protein
VLGGVAGVGLSEAAVLWVEEVLLKVLVDLEIWE